MDEREHVKRWEDRLSKAEASLNDQKRQLSKAERMISNPQRWCGESILLLDELLRRACKNCPPMDARFAKCVTGPKKYKVTYAHAGVAAERRCFISMGGYRCVETVKLPETVEKSQ